MRSRNTSYSQSEVPTISCNGSEVAYAVKEKQPHQTSNPWAPCWKCHRPMGCKTCVRANDLICRRCVVWTDRDQFIQHGNISNDVVSVSLRGGSVAPNWDQYPSEWAAEYRKHGSVLGVSDEVLYQDCRKRINEYLRVVVRRRASMTPPSEEELQRRRNEQVRKLAGTEWKGKTETTERADQTESGKQ